MKVYVLYLDEDTQVCSTMEKAIDAAKETIMSWSVDNIEIAKVDIDPDGEGARIDFSYYLKLTYYVENAWIYAYEVDGGPIC